MTIRLQKILLPTDFSTYSATATKYACELAAKFDAELHLLHTLEHHVSSTPAFGMGLALPTSPGLRQKKPWPLSLIRSG
jgi:nucleotide-binding universal stress UspA family protein